jgi:hypothetical protein
LDLLGTRLAWLDCRLHMLRGRTGLHFLDAGKAAKCITDALLTPGTTHRLLTHHHQLEGLDLLSSMIFRSRVACFDPANSSSGLGKDILTSPD